MTRGRRVIAVVVAAALVAASGCTDGRPEPVAIELRQIDGVGAYFEPAHLEIPVGTEVRWSNTTSGIYSIQSGGADGTPAGAEPWDSGPLGPGETFSYVADVPGSYVYGGSGAPQLVGTLEVTG